MPPIAYTVIARLPDQATASEYVAWLAGGHVAAVVAAGAMSGQIIRSRDPPLEVETRYLFPDRETFERYLRESAPGLRAEGLKRFPTGIRFERRVGIVV